MTYLGGGGGNQTEIYDDFEGIPAYNDSWPFHPTFFHPTVEVHPLEQGYIGDQHPGPGCVGIKIKHGIRIPIKQRVLHGK